MYAECREYIAGVGAGVSADQARKGWPGKSRDGPEHQASEACANITLGLAARKGLAISVVVEVVLSIETSECP